LEQADNVLLEPIYEAFITVPMNFMGRVMTDIQKYHGSAAEPLQKGDNIIITAYVPVATFKDYGTELASMTSGRGRLRMKVSSYDRCHNSEEVMETVAYDKDNDELYPSGSVFCKKGKGFTIPWHEARSYMHCDMKYLKEN